MPRKSKLDKRKNPTTWWGKLNLKIINYQNYRMEIKRGARNRLKTPKWKPLFMSLVAILVLYFLNLFAYNLSGYTGYMDNVGVIYENAASQNPIEMVKAFFSASWPGIRIDAIIIVLALLALYAVVECGFMSYALKAVRGEKIAVKDQFDSFNYAFKSLVIRLAQTMGMLIGMALLIVPGILFTIAYSQAVYVMIDNPEMTAVQCMKESRRMMKGKMWEYFWLMLSFLGWYILSSVMALFTIPLVDLWIVPFRTFTYAEYYNDLLKREKDAEEAARAEARKAKDYEYKKEKQKQNKTK